MKKEEIQLICDVVAKVVIESLQENINKIVRNEVNKVLNENKVSPQKKRQQSSYRNALGGIYSEEFNEMLQESKSVGKKVRPKNINTGNVLIDEILSGVSSEEEIIERHKPNSGLIEPTELIPIEEIYLNDVKDISPEMAQSIDYTEFLNKMSENKSEPMGSMAMMGGGASPRSMYTVDKASIIQEQRITGPTKIEKQIR